MATMLKFLHAMVLFNLICQGNCECYPITSLEILQYPTGLEVQNTPQWEVAILNTCYCVQYSIKLFCDGFQSVEDIDTSILSLSEDGCQVNNGQVLYGHGTFNFTYAWNTQFPFMPIFSQIACS